MRQAGTKNPVFLLDEVDKLGVSFQGDPSSALLEVLDPAQNSTFVDHYLGIPFDLSEVLFIATANFLDRIPGPLLDRMERVDFSGYTEAEKLQITKRYLLPRQRRENSLTTEELSITDDALLTVVQNYTREAGVRQLEREVGKLARKVARQIAGGKIEEIDVTPEDVRELLGRPRVHPERMAAEDTVGVATGMFYTPMGGDIMFVEASIMPGEGGLVLTGQLGDVMKESGRAALSFAKANWKELDIPEEALKGREVHIHVPAGAIPKDGPSAGITMATALISAVSGRKVRRDVAMTGELTLTGRVLPIGGVKEKVLGAVRAGIREIILPVENEADLDDLRDDVREELTFHLAETLDDVIEVAMAERSEAATGEERPSGSRPPAEKGAAAARPASAQAGKSGGRAGRRSPSKAEAGNGRSRREPAHPEKGEAGMPLMGTWVVGGGGIGPPPRCGPCAVVPVARAAYARIGRGRRGRFRTV
jgi:ATP-dependent Lon protease